MKKIPGNQRLWTVTKKYANGATSYFLVIKAAGVVIEERLLNKAEVEKLRILGVIA